jgi:hypothetical protein
LRESLQIHGELANVSAQNSANLVPRKMVASAEPFVVWQQVFKEQAHDGGTILADRAADFATKLGRLRENLWQPARGQARYVAWYNLRGSTNAESQTPAMASRLTGRVWTIKELIQRAAA